MSGIAVDHRAYSIPVAPVPDPRQLAARFKNGEKLATEELVVLYKYLEERVDGRPCECTGNHVALCAFSRLLEYPR